MRKIALIILSYNNHRDTLNCVESVLKHNTAAVKFVVVDNGSRADELAATAEGLRAIFGDRLELREPSGSYDKRLGEATLLQLPENTGYARGNNAGLELAYGDDETGYVMILNNDILFVEDIIPRLVAEHASLADCALISPILYKRGMEGIDYNCARRNVTVGELTRANFLHYWWRLKGRTEKEMQAHRYVLVGKELPDRPMAIELPSGSCMLAEKDFFRSIGSFDPATFLYYEENILFRKIEKTGRKNYLCPGLSCIHLGASTMTKSTVHLTTVLHSYRSMKYYVHNYSGAGFVKRAVFDVSRLWCIALIRLSKMLSSSRKNAK